MNYSDLPVPDEIDGLFESEPPLAMPELDLGSAIIQPLVEAPRSAQTQASPQPEAPEMALVLHSGAAPETGSSPAQALVTAQLFSQEKYVLYYLAGSRYAVPMSQVLEVCELNSFTPVPNVPEWIMGVTNLRGDIVSIVDIRALFNLEAEEYADANSLLVTHTFEGDITACLVVEHVIGIADIAAPQIQTIDTMVEDRLAPYVRGVHAHSDGLVSVLNLEGLLHSLDIVHYRP
ncbi:MAG TPA: chemotaxis protein CheW [Blastocatellia bacterium]|nr:chemotaxis protein CheW [Blastocatellia bacterium]